MSELTFKDFETDQEVRWCPGCGDYSILSNVQKVMPELGVPRENIVFERIDRNTGLVAVIGWLQVLAVITGSVSAGLLTLITLNYSWGSVRIGQQGGLTYAWADKGRIGCWPPINWQTTPLQRRQHQKC